MKACLTNYGIAPGFFDVSKMAVLPENQYTQLTVTSFEQALFAEGEVGPRSGLRVDGGYLNQIERPYRSDIENIQKDDFNLKYGPQELGAAYNWITGEYRTSIENPEDIDLTFANGYLIGLKGLENALADVKSADISEKLLIVRKKLDARIRIARRFESLRIGEYVESRRGVIWSAELGMTYNDEGCPETGKAAPLLGFGIEKVEEEDFDIDLYKNTPVVLGNDGRTYRQQYGWGRRVLYGVVDRKYYDYGHAQHSSKQLGLALVNRLEQRYAHETW